MSTSIIGKWSLKYVALFALIQLVSLILTLIGYPLIAVLAAFKLWRSYAPYDCEQCMLQTKLTEWRGGKLTWLWGNDENGIFGNGPITRWQAFYWSAIRNSANNLRFVRDVSGAGRPLWHWTNGTYYAQAGWLGSNGQPVLSLGRGGGY